MDEVVTLEVEPNLSRLEQLVVNFDERRRDVQVQAVHGAYVKPRAITPPFTDRCQRMTSGAAATTKAETGTPFRSSTFQPSTAGTIQRGPRHAIVLRAHDRRRAPDATRMRFSVAGTRGQVAIRPATRSASLMSSGSPMYSAPHFGEKVRRRLSAGQVGS
jgi:hypothetical protein